MDKVLIVNTGSASKKFALYEGERELWRAHLEQEDGGLVMSVLENGKTQKSKVSKKDFDEPVSVLKDRIGNLAVAGVRVVAPGSYFLENRKIDAGFIKNLKIALEQAPLHVAPALAAIGQLKKVLPKMELFAISDSAFYADLPQNAKLYSLPSKISEKFGIYRYGYHGISIHSVLEKIKKMPGGAPDKIIVCHLGSGSTVAAIKGGRPFDTSMGFTPLEGVPMGTRIGNIDAGAVIYLAKKTKMSPDKLGEFFNRECGLLGLSGKTADVRELLELEKRGDAGAAQALESFVYGVKKLIGAYAAAMSGLDLLVFTATIGERSFIMRHRICAGLETLGIRLDENKNNSTFRRDGSIGVPNSSVKISVILTDELGEMRRELSILQE